MEVHSIEGVKYEQYANPYPQVAIESNSTTDPLSASITKRRKSSFVWDYFRPSNNSAGSSLKCIICGSSVSRQTSNLARHLLAAHDISRQVNNADKENKKFVSNSKLIRPSQSFVWKYCTKVDNKYSCCHLCDKLLYFGGGNTANISKHLRRKHSEVIRIHELENSKDMEDTEELLAIISSNQMDSTVNSCEEEGNKAKHVNLTDSAQMPKERKGSSYVWNYCEKLSRHEIRCKLCKKVMSFHGTANVITHLQRRHNIVGRVENDRAIFNITGDDTVINLKDDPDSTARRYRRRRSSASTSVVWKYCTRLTQDVVRCSLCKKNLSFQGTSNLQRHLHRMHGIVTRGRRFVKLEQETVDIDDNFIWEYCEHTEDKIKCTMCSSTFDEKRLDDIRKHLRETHAILSKAPPNCRKRRRRNVRSEETSDDSDECDYDNEDETSQGGNMQYSMDFADTDIKKDLHTFEDIIEEDNAEQIDCDEDPFDPNMMHNYPEARPLSPASSHDISPEPTIKMSLDTNRLRKLNEERMRVETQYFREKAGYYRMQKYFTALQAKKARIDLERLQRSDSTGTVYQANIDMSDTHTSTATLFHNHKE